MKLWLTAQELADLQLEGFPVTKRGVQKIIDRDGWQECDLCRKREGRDGGGGFEYHLSLLPLPQRLDYTSRFVRVEQADCLTDYDETLNGTEREARDARLIILRVAERFRKTSSMGATGADDLFVRLYLAGKVPVPEWVRGAVRRLSTRTLARWRDAKASDASSLANDPSKVRKGTGVLDRAEDGRLKSYCLALVAHNDFLTAEHIRDTAIVEFGESVLLETTRGQVRKSMPPLRTFQRALKQWKQENRNELLKITNPDAWKSKVRFSMAGAHSADRLNQIWEIDASPSDVMTTDGRMNIYMAIDLYSRRIILLVTKTPRASAVGLLIRKCLIGWGVPELIKTDNGSDFTAKATVKLLDALDIEQELSPPYSPEKKGSVERVIGTFQRDCAATLPGFVGHSVADRKKIEARKAFSSRLGTDDAKMFHVDLSANELQEHADFWTNQIYAHKKHSRLKGKTPFELAQDWKGEIRGIQNEAALDVLLAPIAGKNGIRTVTKEGIRHDNEKYVTFDVPAGEEVLCREDPADQGRLWLFDPEGETYLGEAVCPDLAGVDRAEIAARMKERQKALHDEKTADIKKELRKITPRTVMDARRERYKHNGDVVPFPKERGEHSTAKMQAAGSAKAKRGPRPLSQKEQEVMERMRAAEQPGQAPGGKSASVHSIARQETPERRFSRAMTLEARIAEGASLCEDDALWLVNYQSGAEYRAHKMLNQMGGQKTSVPPAS
ncbi:transposase protein A [Roseibium sp. TrichSKD4]|uniref:DDE-type integrase/transposase/recombinase n=1 Tax=Roseibium sp. TrichSKD4 TaxID=744980 RepID=UPI0001E56D3D|nr:DDE-type integrase/transposase/recombinase [Roseibium sp. TrichSKD4]EFO33254.1 transposase protein A [Roseibium sp. TrichSKD4]